MPFSVSTWPLRAYQSSPSSRRILKTVAIGLDYLKDSKILKLVFGIEGSLWFKSVPRRSTWLNSTPVCGRTTAGQVGAGGLYGMNTTALYPPVGGGYMIWKKKKRSKSVKCFCFTYPKKNIDSAQKESRLSGYLGFANLTLGLGSSLGPQVYVESEYLISLSCQKTTLFEAIRRRAKPSAMGTRTAEGFWKDQEALTNVPGLSTFRRVHTLVHARACWP